MTLPTDVQAQQPGTTPPEGTPGQPPVTQQLPGSITDWEARYKGQQRAMQLQAEANVALTGERETLLAQIAALNADKAALAQQLNTTAQTVEAKGGEVATVLTEKQKLEAELLRAKTLLRAEFRDLADFEAAGVLPKPENATEEMLVTAFTQFKSALGQVKQTVVTETMAGSTPPAPPVTPGNQTPSKSQLNEQAMAASKRGDRVEYDRIMKELFALE